MDINGVLETSVVSSKLFRKARVISIDVVVSLALIVADLTNRRG